MTTFRIQGVTVTENSNGTAASVVAEQIILRTSDDYLLRYQRIGPLEPNDLAEIDLFPGVGMDYQEVVGTVRPGPGWGAMIGEVRWSGHTSQVMVFEHPGTVDKWTLFQLGGDALPALTTPTQVKAFFDSMTSLKGSLSGSFAENTNFDVRDFASFISATENDRIIANGRYDDWSGLVIKSGRGHDLVKGVSANDRFELGSGNDTGVGGSGRDTIIGGTGNDSLKGESGNDILRGGEGNDYGFGGTGNDKLVGEAGRDKLEGGLGVDTLYGGAGNDSLIGGTGNDVLSGGLGADNFRFSKGGGTDRVMDFTNNVDDLVLTGFGSSFAVTTALAAATNITGGVRFDFGNGDIMTVLGSGITKAALADDIFIL